MTELKGRCGYKKGEDKGDFECIRAKAEEGDGEVEDNFYTDFFWSDIKPSLDVLKSDHYEKLFQNSAGLVKIGSTSKEKLENITFIFDHEGEERWCPPMNTYY
jgi:hypothetical protein